MSMKTFLVFNAIESEPEIVEKTWKNPRVIDSFWFGDHGSNALSCSSVFPNTPKARAELEKLQELYAAARAAKDVALRAQMEVLNMKTRGELD